MIINKPANEAGREEKCVNCSTKEPLQRVYTTTAIKTEDGFKK